MNRSLIRNTILAGALFVAVSVEVHGQSSTAVEVNVRLTEIPRHLPSAKRLLVFIHGISGDGRRTWTRGDFYWPEALAKDPAFAGDQVLVLDYPSARLDRRSSLVDIAAGVNHALWQYGAFDRFESVSFIAHSMGGLITKKVLSQLELASNARTNRLARVRSVVYLATPHRGAGLGTWLSYFGGFPDLAADGVNRLLSELDGTWTMALIDRDSTNRDTQYRSPSMQKSIPYIACAIETSELPVVVTDSSAAGTVCATVRRFPLDHGSIAAPPEGAQGDLYSWVNTALLSTSTLSMDCSSLPPRLVQRPKQQCSAIYYRIRKLGYTTW